MLTHHTKIAPSLILLLSPILCFGWSEPVVISASQSFNPSLSVSANGDAVVVWTRDGGENRLIESSCYESGKWSKPHVFTDKGNNLNPKVRIDKSGNAFALWEALNEGSRYLMGSKKYGDGNWEEPTTLAEILTSSAPAFSMNSNGQIVVGWISLEGSIKIMRSTTEADWMPEQVIESEKGEKRELKLRLDDSGHMMAVWHNVDSDKLFFTQSQNGFDSKWEDPLQLYTISNYIDLNFSINSTGEAILSWIDLSNFGFATALYLNGSWAETPQTTLIGTYFLRTAGSEEEFYLSWLDAESGKILCMKTEEGKWGEIDAISPSMANAPFNLAMTVPGDAKIAWSDFTSGQIFISEYSKAGAVSEPSVISIGDLNLNPKTASAEMLTVAVWENYTGTDQTIQVSIDSP